MKNRPSAKDIVLGAAVGLLLAAVIALTFIFWKDIIDIVRNPEAVRAWIAGFGPWAPLVFIGIQFLQVVVFVIPGEVTQPAGGYLFGIGWGTLYSLIGICLGSCFAFLVARSLGLPFVTRLFGAENVAKFETFISSEKAIAAFFLLFLIPGIPKDILCYVAGLSYLPLPVFLLVSTVARLPAQVGSTIIGNAAASQNWPIFAAVAGVALVLFVLGIIFRQRVHELLGRMVKRPEPTNAPQGDDGTEKNQNKGEPT